MAIYTIDPNAHAEATASLIHGWRQAAEQAAQRNLEQTKYLGNQALLRGDIGQYEAMMSTLGADINVRDYNPKYDPNAVQQGQKAIIEQIDPKINEFKQQNQMIENKPILDSLRQTQQGLVEHKTALVENLGATIVGGKSKDVNQKELNKTIDKTKSDIEEINNGLESTQSTIDSISNPEVEKMIGASKLPADQIYKQNQVAIQKLEQGKAQLQQQISDSGQMYTQGTGDSAAQQTLFNQYQKDKQNMSEVDAMRLFQMRSIDAHERYGRMYLPNEYGLEQRGKPSGSGKDTRKPFLVNCNNPDGTRGSIDVGWDLNTPMEQRVNLTMAAAGLNPKDKKMRDIIQKSISSLNTNLSSEEASTNVVAKRNAAQKEAIDNALAEAEKGNLQNAKMILKNANVDNVNIIENPDYYRLLPVGPSKRYMLSDGTMHSSQKQKVVKVE